jgi:ribonuclease HII
MSHHTAMKTVTVSSLVAFDQQLGGSLIGADEVGRGSWVGPVVAAAVHIPPTLLVEPPDWLNQLNDSKQLKQNQRVWLSGHIQQHTQFTLAEASLEEIEQLNLHHASLLACYRAVSQLHHNVLPIADPLVLVDGCYTLPNWPGRQQAVIKGDGQSAHIAAASILAKVHRDAMLTDWHNTYPQYQWASNKGYGTPSHLKALSRHGPCPLHRPRFLKKWLATQAANIAEV